MYIVPIAWLYVAVMMAIAEATSSQGTVLGAFFTFVLYGLMPIGLVLYFMGTPARRRQRLEREAEEAQAYLAAQAAQQAQAGLAAQAAAAPTAEPVPEPAQAMGSLSAASPQTNTGDLAPGDFVPPVGKEP